MPNWAYIVLLVLAIYILLSLLLYILQDYFLFKPEKLPKEFQFYYENQETEEYNIETRDGAVINGLRFKAQNPKGVVFYLKGNSKSIKGWGKFAVDFTRHGYDVIMVDYRGFGKSTGRRTQKAIKRDMQVVYNKIKEKVPERYIILYGRSLGSGFAAKLASMNNPRMLILDAPYYSLSKVAKKFIPFMPLSLLIKFPMPTYKWLKYVNCPIHIIHGTDDRLIPYKTSVKLSKIKPRQTTLHTVIGGGHKDLNTFESYHKMLGEIITSHPKKVDLKGSSIDVGTSSKQMDVKA
ncbi:MAG: alpha/beta hydrolase [Muricauda sp.]|uniref:Hydrolase n=1 Tax=Flagellimonas lutaonensis TaxID=516051 RepID=A0A0D5YWP8_9FLAO|nr:MULTISPECIES: alpha/beta fold hydrolase [Allomuricauda]AKA36319.1 hydrolase [Allomuricauda lutaonensis]MBC29911.1 alpha/beta hydrolase [Allomuricauda sp.]|tara:strand:+ start:28908 stop:29783 length:876 start_codon:yes stop_codon:yes gene_type:complete